MSRTNLLPQSFWFRLALPCRRVDALPRAKGRLLDLPDSCTLPDISTLEGLPSWASVRAAWNPSGLAIAVEVTGKLQFVQMPGQLEFIPLIRAELKNIKGSTAE